MNAMLTRLFLVILFIMPAAASDTLTYNNIYVKHTADNAETARNTAQTQAYTQAMMLAGQQLLLQQDWPALYTLAQTADTSTIIASTSVDQERANATTYEGTLSVEINLETFKNLLSEKGLSPIKNAPAQTITINVPEGLKDQFTNLMRQKNITARLGFTPQTSIKQGINGDYTLNDDGAYIVLNKSAQPISITPHIMTTGAIWHSLLTLSDTLKTPSAPKDGTQQTLDAALSITSVQDWIIWRKKLQDVPNIKEVSTSGISPNQIDLSLTYFGATSGLEYQLKQIGLQLQQQNNNWYLAPIAKDTP